MVNVYIRRKKNFVIFYSRRRRGFETQGPSSTPSFKDTTSLKEDVQNDGFFSNSNDFTDIGFVEGIPTPCISVMSHENTKLEFESNATVTTIKPENGNVLDTQEILPKAEKDRIPIDIGLINNESLLTVIQQLTSSLRLSKRPRSARKPTSSASRKWSRFEYSASDDSKQMVSHFGESTSVCCEVIPKTPIKEDKISKFTSRSLVSDVHSLLSTGVLDGAPVKYMKDNVELSGIVTTSGIYCGCSLCNFKEVVSSLKFEKHAGSKSHNQNAHIFLENGISLYALSKELKNVSLESLGRMIAEKFGYPTIMEVYKDWKGNTILYRNKVESSNQKNFPDLVDQLQANLNFPKGPRSTRTKKPPLSDTSKVNHKVSRQLTFCDVDPQHPPAHKKRGVDILSSNDELSSKKSSEITSLDAYESNIREFVSQNVRDLNIGKKKAIILSLYTPESLLSTVSCLLATGLLDGIMVNYKKDEIDLRGIIKDIGICCGCESCRFSKVLSSLDFGKHGGGEASRDLNDYIFVNDKITLSSLVRELKNLPLGLLSGELVQKMIGCQPNIVCFLAWKESFRDKKSNPRRTSGDDVKNPLAHVFCHNKPSAAERLRLCGSEDNFPLLSGEDVKVKLPRKGEKTMKHKEQDFHQQIFYLLNDGSKLSYRSHGEEVLAGHKFGKNILCSCCNLMLSASKFEAHAGHEKRRKPYHSIYTSYHKSLNQIAMLLLLDAPSINPINVLIPSYPTDKQSPPHASSPLRFHSRRLLAPCNLRSCVLCRNGEATLNFGNICDSTMLFCGQCGGMFHVGCLRNHGICDVVGRPCPSDIWLCGDKCKKVHTDLLDFLQEGSMIIPESLLNLLRRTSVGNTFNEETKFDVHWQLLSGRFHGDKSKSLLQQVTTVFQEAFGAVYKRHRDVLSTMVNGEKGVAEFFGGMFCAVLTVKSIIVSAALLRVFDNRVAELLLAATPKERRGEGYFKILLWKIEELLRLMKMENMIVAADEQSLPMWVEKFGFSKLSIDKIQEYEMNHRILTFENTTMLQKLVPSAAAFFI
ncbi:hypothetical protein KSP39_PZI003512 [Platanthera zijinensis]|uniref:N-acetyltransferase domain-containing protein n=1 Tax=Platanthera zijinensis TaxID=2320716 RepID=A0AAP0BWG5_9ASPA